MQEAAFRAYLDQNFDKGDSHKYRGDILSRCKRVEDQLAIDLDDYTDREDLREKISSIAPDDNGQRSLLSAVARYFVFKSNAS